MAAPQHLRMPHGNGDGDDLVPPPSPGARSGSHVSITRSLSCPSLYEAAESDNLRPRGRVRRVASMSRISPHTRPFNDRVAKFATNIQSVNVYERIDYDTSDEENESDAEGFESDHDGDDDEFQWEEDIPKPPTYGAMGEGEKRLLRRRKTLGELELRGTDNKRKTVFTIFKAFIASGILFLPNGVAKAGWALALIILIFTAILTTWCMLLLLWAKNKLVADGHRVLSFGDVGEYACGPWGRRSVDIAIFGAQLGFCCAYFGFVGENLHSVIYSYFDCYNVDQKLIMVLMIPLLAPMVWVRKLKHYAVTNIIADILIVAPLMYIMSYEADMMRERGLGPKVEAFRWATCLPFFGTTVYSMEGISMIIPIEQSMKRKEDLPKVLIGCMVFITALMGVFGVWSYLAFGTDTASIITLNLGDPAQDNVVVDVIKLAYCVAIVFTFPLMMFPVVKIVERTIYKKDRHSGKKWSKNLTRTLLTCFCCGIAILGAEQIDNFVSIVGSLTCVPLAFIFPAVFHYQICCQQSNSAAYFKHSFSRLRAYSWSNIGIAIFGFLAMIMATALAVYAWISAPEKEPEICYHNVTSILL